MGHSGVVARRCQVLALVFAATAFQFGPLGAQPADGDDDDRSRDENQIDNAETADQGFAATPLPIDDASSNSDNAGTEIGIFPQDRFNTLPGIELEGIRTQSILIETLAGSSVEREGRAAGMLTATVAIPGQMTSRDEVPCTATLIDIDIVLTAYHCFPGVVGPLAEQGYRARKAEVTFGFDSDSSEVSTYAVKRVIDADKELGFAVLQLAVPLGQSGPGAEFGWVNLSLESPKTQQLRMFHHPYGYFKMVLQDSTCRRVVPEGALETRLYHQCDTRGGSSGAALLGYSMIDDYTGVARPMAYGVHIAGKKTGLADPERDFNQAVPISAIAEKSSYIEKIGCRRIMSSWECPDRALARPISIYFDWDSSNLTPVAISKLDELFAKVFTADGGGNRFRVSGFRLVGYSDNFGSETYLQGVSERRASAVAQYLAMLGTPLETLSLEGRGSDGAPEGRDPEMRRVDILVDYEYLWN